MPLDADSLARNKTRFVHNLIRDVDSDKEVPWNPTPDSDSRIRSRITRLYHQQEGRCAVTGMPLDSAYTGKYWGNRIVVSIRDHSRPPSLENLQITIRMKSAHKSKRKYGRELEKWCITYLRGMGYTVVDPGEKSPPHDDNVKAVSRATYSKDEAPFIDSSDLPPREPVACHCLTCDPKWGEIGLECRNIPAPDEGEDGQPLPF